MQQRSSAKITFPEIWANTCCSHPLHVDSELIENEALGVRTAARRKLEQELGINPNDVPLETFTWITRVHYVGASIPKNEEATRSKSVDVEPLWGEHEIDWILMCIPPKTVKMVPNPNEVQATRAFTQSELKEWMTTRSVHGNEVSPWFGVMEKSGLLYKWWDAVLERRLDTVLERDVIHRQHDLETKANGKTAAMPKAFKSCLATTKASGTAGPMTTITCAPVLPLFRSSANSTRGSTSSSTTTAAPSTSTTAAIVTPPVAAYVPGASAAVPKQGAYGKVKIHKDSLISQLSHLDEIFVGVSYKLGLMNPVRVAGLPKDASPALIFCEDMLCKVSRSFAMVIQQLPQHLRISVCVFYLVLRGLDTVEDDMEAFATRNDEKLRLLHAFHTFLSIKGWSMDGVGEGDEKTLLQNFGNVVEVFTSLHKFDQEVIADICRRMGDGMAEFSGRDLREGTTTIKDYNLYCHYVAGLVGEGLSRLFAAHGDEDAEVAKDLKLADDMGLFLQKTNIIRDYLEDLVDGRAFWPKEVWSQYSPRLKDLADFVKNKDSNEKELAIACLNHMVADALTLLPSCIQYISRLRDADVFKFCAIPQVMAIATLERLVNNADVFTGVLKIRKGQALLLMSQANNMDSVCSIFLTYTRLIIKQIPRRHAKAFETAAKASDKIEKLCLDLLPPTKISSTIARIVFNPLIIVAVMVTLVLLLAYLYQQSVSRSWSSGERSYMPRITDSFDVGAVAGVVACVAYLLGCGGASFSEPPTAASSPLKKKVA